MALGAHKAELGGHGFKHVWANDIEKDACATFRHNLNIKPKNVICCDVNKLNLDNLPSIDGFVRLSRNDFSMVGDRKGITGEYLPSTVGEYAV